MEESIFRERLSKARERKGWSIDEAATRVATDSIINRASYYDVELCEGDLTGCCSLNQILSICKLLDIHPSDLFCEEKTKAISISEVIDRIKTHCTEKRISIGEFEEIAGWRVENCLINPANALEEWNVDCLMDVCRELNIDWRFVITGL
jgi:hypothetical protein